MRVHINVARCVEYLRGIGAFVADEDAERWATIEAETRATRRANRRELKRSCGHFRTHWTRVVDANTGFAGDIKYCQDCGLALSERPDPPPKRRKPIPRVRTA